MNKEIIWSYGGGVQSIAIMVLIKRGLIPKPDRTIMVDTGRERTLTWRYMNDVAIPYMREIGIEPEIVSHSYARVDLFRGEKLLLPAYTANGRLPAFCSGEWKREVMKIYLRKMEYGRKRPIIMWLGMSLDEIDRMRLSDIRWIENHYPLIFDHRLRRHECLLEIEREGLPKPYKSACWCCPNQNDDEWKEIKDETPDDFYKAVELEQEINRRDILSGHSGVWLHRSRMPLNQVLFTEKQQKDEQMCAFSCWT